MTNDPSGDEIEPLAADPESTPPPSQASSEAQAVVSALVQTSYEYRGPVPPPAHLREYEDICPGSAKQMFNMAQSQAKHRQDVEAIVIKGKDRRATHGLYIGGFLATVVLALAFILILTGRSIAGFGTLIGEAAVLSGVFIFGRTQQRKERETKAQLAPPPQLSLPFPESNETD